MKYLLLLLIPIMYFPLKSADKLSSKCADSNVMLYKATLYKSVIGVAIGGILLYFGEKNFYVDK